MRVENIHCEAVGRGGVAAAGRASCASSLRPPASRLHRRGISLLEVLISMFVLLFGLMGVAAIFPVGNHYAGRGDQYERGAALAGTAFAEMKARGMLDPSVWIYADGTDFLNGPNFYWPFAGVGPGHAFVIDPIGAAETELADAQASYFPYAAGGGGTNPWLSSSVAGTPPLPGTSWPIRRITWPTPDPTSAGDYIRMPSSVAQSVFQLRDDLTVQLPSERDRPGVQKVSASPGADTHEDDTYDDIPIARDHVGSYSWIATVVPTNFAAHSGMQKSDPRHGSFLYEASVAVMFKREGPPSVDSERMLAAELAPGGDLVLYDMSNDLDVVEAAIESIRPGRWIALAGVDPKSGKFLLRWYRLLAIDDEPQRVVSAQFGPRAGVNAMVEGPTWPAPKSAAGLPLPAINLRAILVPGVIGVTTQTVKLNVED
jgi:hypothetical protein